MIAIFLMAGCGNIPKAGASQGETQSGKQLAQDEAKPGPASAGKALTAKEAFALAEESATKELGKQVDIAKVYGDQKDTDQKKRKARRFFI